MERLSVSVLAICVLLTVIKFAHGIRCYKCSSGWVGGDLTRESPDCRSNNLTLLSPFAVDCGSPLIFQWCSTVETATGAFSRGCNLNMTSFGVQPGSCTPSKGKLMCLCDQPLCNNVAIMSETVNGTLVLTNITIVQEPTTSTTTTRTTTTTISAAVVVAAVTEQDHAVVVAEVIKPTLVENRTTSTNVPSSKVSATVTVSTVAAKITGTSDASNFVASVTCVWLVALGVIIKNAPPGF